MGSPKWAWCQFMMYVMISVWFAGCSNKEFSAPIGILGGGNCSSTITIIDSMPQLRQSRSTVNNDKYDNRVHLSPQGKIIYNRNYDRGNKGSYAGVTYQVKCGDTLFYIAWITGNDYQYLAQKNHIQKPYGLNIGQIIQVDNGTNDANNAVVSARISPVVAAALPTSKTLSATATGGGSNNGSTPIIAWRWPTDGKIINYFSAAEGGSKGVDISGFQGQPILATASGRVVYAGNALRGYGNLIIIKHNDDYLSAYAYNDTLLVREQQKVRTGQKIATMGSTGTNSTTRLHFEIRYKGKSVNPLNYLPQR